MYENILHQKLHTHGSLFLSTHNLYNSLKSVTNGSVALKRTGSRTGCHNDWKEPTFWTGQWWDGMGRSYKVKIPSAPCNSQNFDHLWFMIFWSSIVEYLLTLKGFARNMYTSIIDVRSDIQLNIFEICSFRFWYSKTSHFCVPTSLSRSPKKCDLTCRGEVLEGSPNDFNWLLSGERNYIIWLSQPMSTNRI